MAEQPSLSPEQKEQRELADLMNNFWMHLPGARGLFVPIDTDPFRNFIEHHDGYSEKRLDQSDKEFSDTMDDEAEKLGLDSVNIKEMVTQIVVCASTLNELPTGSPERSGIRKKQTAIAFELNKIIKPLFLRLLEMGYTEKDLKS